MSKVRDRIDEGKEQRVFRSKVLKVWIPDNSLLVSTHVSDLIWHFVEVRVLHGLPGCYPVSWITSQHPVEKIEALFI